ncbi:acyl-CoA dehydrogenase family protein [Amorphus sp. 3PC139-8]|uniref:acyl-CoA dehydrogenase family protein n=1 Tax=Amorphus sp. 3PC139-8 TaxID=2735676 RepID=UPI00345D64EC
MFDDLDPKEFEETAAAVIESCAEAADIADRATLLAEAGLLGVTAPEAVGGLGLPIRFAVPIASAAGAGLLAFPVIEALLLTRALAKTAPEMATAIGAGEVVATIAWSGTAEDGVVGAAPLAAEADRILVFRADGGAVLIAAKAATVVDAAPSLDLEAPDATIRLAGAPDGIALDAATVHALREEAKLLRTAFVMGSAARCLTLAADYAQERSQFGKPLSANQVLRHRLSRDALAIETMRSALHRALAEPAEGPEMARDAAWLTAAQDGPVVAESAIQLFGGMGFTWEVPLHRHLRQIRTQTVHGAAADALDDLGAALLSGTNNTWYGEIANAV